MLHRLLSCAWISYFRITFFYMETIHASFASLERQSSLIRPSIVAKKNFSVFDCYVRSLTDGIASRSACYGIKTVKKGSPVYDIFNDLSHSKSILVRNIEYQLDCSRKKDWLRITCTLQLYRYDSHISFFFSFGTQKGFIFNINDTHAIFFLKGLYPLT